MPETNDVPTNKLTVYLIKQEITELVDIVDTRQEPLPIEGVGYFVSVDSHQHKPNWATNFFGSTLDDNQNIFNSSAKGALIVPINTVDGTRYFALAFGFGRYLLKEGVVEERFGLKVTLNSVNANSFRSIDKTTLSSIPKHSREQMSKKVTPAEFGIDIEQDLVNSVTGESRDELLGKTVTGKDALSVSVKVDLQNVQEFLEHCYRRYKSTDYRTDFGWIDQIAEVRDKTIQDQLNTELISKIAANDLEKIWMSVPEVVDWSDVAGFRYIRGVRGDLYDDLDVPTFLAELQRAPEIEELRANSIFAVSASTEEVLHKWPALQCMYAECRVNNKLYILNNGKWYEIADSFCQEVDRDYANIPRSAIMFPDCEINDEGTYNRQAVNQIPDSCCMDRQLISYGGGRSSIEFCDIYTSGGKMIHVKRYGGSSVLSHLFSQGVVAGELFVTDPDFREKLNTVLPESHKLEDPQDRPITPEHEIVFAIISQSLNELDIPFFSKVNLRNARRRLTGYGYSVSLKKIQRTEDVIASVDIDVL
jgi:uncharacterized protein (TIGR04141 family)